MKENTRIVIQSMFEASNNGSIHFGEVIGQLASVQVESYHVDYRSGRTSYFLPDGGTLDMHFERTTDGIAEAFDCGAVHSAVLRAQQGELMYPEFKRLSQSAGCIGYTVWIAGRHVVYIGRRGGTHTELFPN